MQEAPTLRMGPGVVTRSLVSVAAALILLSTVGQFIRFLTGHDTAKEFIPLFHVATEGNITTYFSAILLLIAAVLLGWIGWTIWKAEKASARHWLGLGAFFAYLSVDEAAALHERLIVPVREILEVGGLFNFAWVVPGMAVVLLLGGLYLRFFFRLPRRSRLLFALAAVLYVGGAIGMELLGGAHHEVYGETAVYSAMTTVEETMEMAGVIVFIHGLLLYARDHAPVLRVRLSDAPAPPVS